MIVEIGVGSKMARSLGAGSYTSRGKTERRASLADIEEACAVLGLKIRRVVPADDSGYGVLEPFEWALELEIPDDEDSGMVSELSDVSKWLKEGLVG